MDISGLRFCVKRTFGR